MNKKKQAGIALIQILIMVILLSIFVTHIILTTRNQIEISQLAIERAYINIELTSAFNELTYTLFTTDKIKDYASFSEIQRKWNFYNEPFEISPTVSAKIQDLGGLIGLHFINRDRFINLLIKNEIDYNRAVTIYDRLIDWQDSDAISRPAGFEGKSGVNVRNGFLPNIKDINNVINLTEKERKLIYNNCTIYFNGDFNPLTAPKDVLTGLHGADMANQIIELRKNGLLTSFKYKQLTGNITQDEQTFFPSNSLMLTLTASSKSIQVERIYFVSILRYVKGSHKPINILSIQG